MDGIINIYKESGYTSHDVVAIVRKTLGRVKTGHTGTLDPEAEGVLPICIGKATKLSSYLTADTKSYKAVLKLGITTDTQDTSGVVLTEKEVTSTEDEIKTAILSFIGEYEQVPPMYSAIKVDGKKLYELAREGKEIKRQSRLINIYDIEILEMLDENRVVINVLCSKGTYIRTLCHDIGEALGVGGAMDKLVRTSSGVFKVEDAITLSELKACVQNGKVNDCITSIESVLDYPKARVAESANKFLYNGNKINVAYVESTASDKVLLYNYKNELIGLYEQLQNEFKPIIILTDLTSK